MSNLSLFAVEAAGPRPLAVSEGATQLTELYDDLALGVYTALRTFDQHNFLYLDQHLDRTEQSMALLGWAYRWDRERLCRALDTVCRAAPPGEYRVRIDVLAAPAGSRGTDSRELIALQPFTPLPRALYETGVAVALAGDLARHDPLVKAAEFAARRPATAMLGSGQAPYEYLLTSPDGHILEGTGTNFWGIRDGVVYTAGEGVLEGITRRILLGLLPGLGIPCWLEAVRMEEIAALDEAAISGSSRAFLPVVAIDGRPIGDGRPGPLSARILAAYDRFVADNIRPAV
jgi:branched-chain amino acid aminotransferase